MTKHPARLIAVTLAFALAVTACGGDAEDAQDNNSASTSTAKTDDDVVGRDADGSFEGFGNPDAATVVVVAQGGPVTDLEVDQARDILSALDTDETYVVVPHQAQTLDPSRFTDDEISFDEAKELDAETTENLASVVDYYVGQDREVLVVGISFGAFVVQDLLATQGNVADGYFIQVGRLDMPAEVWMPFSEGRFVGFSDGVEILDVGADEAGMGGDGTFTDANMARLAAGLGHNRYTELLADTDLSNVIYAYGQFDEQVGRLTADELAFLEAKGVTVIRSEGGHGDTIDETINSGLEIMIGAAPGDADDADESDIEDDSDESLGYLPADQVTAYVAAYQSGLVESVVTIDGTVLPVQYVGIESAITVGVDGGSVELDLDDEGLSGATVYWQNREWSVQEEPIVTATPGELGGEGDILETSFKATATDDPDDTVEVIVRLDVNVIGMGNSVVEVSEGYATISGTLGTSTYVQISDIMKNNPDVDTLVMLNVHGSENDEINVHTARLVREAGWTTWVPSNGDISSGGVDMFVAGAQRIVEPGGFVGVHSWGGGEGELTGRDYPRDDSAHRSQLEYFTEMMGDEAGTDFYFYTLEASPFDQIHRMSSAEMDDYGLITAAAPGALPESVIGPPAGYIELAEGSYLKLLVTSCSIVGVDVSAELVSEELGPIQLASAGIDGQLSIPALEGVAPVDHVVTELETEGGTVAGVANLELEAIVGGLDTSTAAFAFPCAAQ